MSFLRCRLLVRQLSTGSGDRFNEFGIQLLPTALHDAIFKDSKPNLAQSSKDENVLNIAKEHLRKHSIPFDKPQPTLKTPVLPLKRMPMFGSNLEEHMQVLGRYAESPYRDVLDDFWRELCELLDDNENWQLERPREWAMASGWTKYERAEDGGWMHTCVPFPDAKVIVFDAETAPGIEGECVVGVQVEGVAPTTTQYRAYPIMAIARSCRHWYSWTAPTMNADPSLPPFDASLGARLVPLGSSLEGPLLVIGHNVCYDRARVLEEYSAPAFWPDTPHDHHPTRRYLDTLSLHCSIAGISSQQRGAWKKSNKAEKGEEEEGNVLEQEAEEDTNSKWIGSSAMNNLVDAVKLHCKATDPMIEEFVGSKESSRDVLMDLTTMGGLREHRQSILSYCSRDVSATLALFYHIWKRWSLTTCPHPITLAAVLEMSSKVALTVQSPGWQDYIQACDRGFTAETSKMEAHLRQLVEDVVNKHGSGESHRTDAWLNKLDWTPVTARYTKARYFKNGSYAKDGEPRPIGNTHLFNKPQWYKELYHGGQIVITARTRILPYLLRMTWKASPVHFVPTHGWCFEDPGGDVRDEAVVDKRYTKIPHFDKEGANVGSLLSKHFLPLIMSGVISTADKDSPLLSLTESNSTWSFWTGYRERITQQMVIWEGEPGVNLPRTTPRLGMIIPSIIAMGTVTRRAVESTWMTASNSKPNLAGSELKSRIVVPCPPPSTSPSERAKKGYVFLGADVDSQELWIASLMGDAQFGQPGATALAWMTLQGTKTEGTDLHSRTASILGMSRDSAKIFNYGRIYGAGCRYASELLCKFNPALTRAEANAKAKELYAATKGERIFGSADPFVQYTGGTESYMFNSMEAMARAEVTQTPCLGAQISDALCSSNVQEGFLTSRVNWVVQSSGVDYLHLLVVIMSVLCRLYGIPARLLLTIHDEVRYLVAKSHQYRAALVLQLANFWTRAYFSYRLGICNLPLSVAFFSGVDFDAVLRKDPNQACRTITSPVDIPPGVTLDIHQLIAKLETAEPPIEQGIDANVVAGLKAARLAVRQQAAHEQAPPGDLPTDKRLHRLAAQFDRNATGKHKKASPAHSRTASSSGRKSERGQFRDGPDEWDGMTKGIDRPGTGTKA